jgi:hypothetical protein
MILKNKIDDTMSRSENLDTWFGTKLALKNMDLNIKPNTSAAIIGPSGCELVEYAPAKQIFENRAIYLR